MPQSKQTTTSGNTHTTGLSILGKWMPISALNLFWLTDPHDLQGTPTLDSETKSHLLGHISFLEWVYGRKRGFK